MRNLNFYSERYLYKVPILLVQTF